jgi:hypothetical protein
MVSQKFCYEFLKVHIYSIYHHKTEDWNIFHTNIRCSRQADTQMAVDHQGNLGNNWYVGEKITFGSVFISVLVSEQGQWLNEVNKAVK